MVDVRTHAATQLRNMADKIESGKMKIEVYEVTPIRDTEYEAKDVPRVREKHGREVRIEVLENE